MPRADPLALSGGFGVAQAALTASDRRRGDGRARSRMPPRSSVVDAHARTLARRYLAMAAPLLAACATLAAWSVALAAPAAGARAFSGLALALAVTVSAGAYAVLVRREARDVHAGPICSPTATVAVLSAGALLGLLVGTSPVPLAVLAALALAAVALLAMAPMRWHHLAFLAVLLGPATVGAVRAGGEGAGTAAVLLAAMLAMGAAQVLLARAFGATLDNDARQRLVLEQLQDDNDALFADRTLLQTQSRTDPLTALANRRYLEESLQAEWGRCRRSGSPLSCILLDIDHFKAFNDHYGHDGGDACLRRVAALLTDTARRPGDLVARFGGEEFVVLLPDTGREGASTVAELIKQAVAQARIAHAKGGEGGRLTVSMGVATIVPDVRTASGQLMKAADLALYEAKRSGRNRIVMADPDTLDAAAATAREQGA